ncbi:MAG TPA: type II toxin-antitoxin system VapC family toxin [Allosphingosinicella sp.]|jgi:predicted nucleic acid-binding protein
MLVVDASVAVKFLVDETGSELARDLIASGQPMVAPEWVLIEVASALQKKVAEQSLSESHAMAAMVALPEYFIELYSAIEELPQALGLGFQLGHPVYDCLYLELAARLRAKVITADVKFVKAAQRAGLKSHVQLLGEAS